MNNLRMIEDFSETQPLVEVNESSLCFPCHYVDIPILLMRESIMTFASAGFTIYCVISIDVQNTYAFRHYNIITV